MKRKAAVILLLAAWLLMIGAAAEDADFSVTAPDEVIRPGWACIISFTVPSSGTCDLLLLDDDGEQVSVIALDRPVEAGHNALYWNGTWNGVAAPKGFWRLVLRMNGETVEAPVEVGPMAPALVTAKTWQTTVDRGSVIPIVFHATQPGTLTVESGEGDLLLQETVEAGNGEVYWEVTLPGGEQELVLILTDEEGQASVPARIQLTVQEPLRSEDVVFTPAWTSPYEGQDTSLNYWTLPMDITDEAAVWEVLTQPVTVLDNGKKNTEKTQVIIRAEPSEDSDGVGVVTCITQGVHVLERGEEWTLIECYSSSFHDSAILNWNALVQGYVPTAYLRETVPNQEYGLVVDKLTQRLYIFREGRLWTTLLVSTGLANKRQPYNETRSGEFLMTSAVGTFYSDNLRCASAIRFNKGDLIHEVPHILQADGVTQNYGTTEPKLGKKASHGCIRVQRKQTPEGVNQAWLWAHRAPNTKLLIWEDWQGRQIPIPDEDLPLYYNPDRGTAYHSADHCASLRDGVTLTPFPYGELDSEGFRKLKRCEYCTPPLRRAEIEEINEEYAFGNDHNPVLTEALKTCPRPLRKK